jgi:hypothetical protein
VVSRSGGSSAATMHGSVSASVLLLLHIRWALPALKAEIKEEGQNDREIELEKTMCLLSHHLTTRPSGDLSAITVGCERQAAPMSQMNKHGRSSVHLLLKASRPERQVCRKQTMPLVSENEQVLCRE